MQSLPALIVHGGAGRRIADLVAEADAGCSQAADLGWAVLQAGGSAIDAVLAAVVALEDDPRFNAGYGACLDAGGAVAMDASIMDGTTLAGGGVAGVSTVRNPIRLAEAVWRDGRHVLLAGAGAEAFARRARLPTAPAEALVTPRQRRRWLERLALERGTVGAVALDRAGRVAAATSTGGMPGKLAGRIGDSAILGAGTYADGAGAVSATGPGEAIIVAGLAKASVDALRDGRHPQAVATAQIAALARRPGGAAGLIIVDRFGRVGSAHAAEHMPIAVRQCAFDLDAALSV
ncbi:MAG: isoaspartyl peptidase/L-asparaginase [bacterium]